MMRQYKYHPFLARLMPFLALGVFIVILIVGIVLLSYVLLWGALIGLVIFVIAYIKSKLFPAKNKPRPNDSSGRVIDHEDIK